MEEPPRDNAEYKLKEYWDERFTIESSYEWLASYDIIKPQLIPHLDLMRTSSVLVVGCGNSNFSVDLFNDGVTNITSIDFSETVIAVMKGKFPALLWKCMDMTQMSFCSESFDYIIDKAAMDALVTDEGDPWEPNVATIKSTSDMMESVSKTLKPNGTFIQISFQQPHFRKSYLIHPDLSTPQVTAIDHGMGYFCFIQKKI